MEHRMLSFWTRLFWFANFISTIVSKSIASSMPRFVTIAKTIILTIILVIIISRFTWLSKFPRFMIARCTLSWIVIALFTIYIGTAIIVVTRLCIRIWV